jgi:hypothetical protein
MFLPFRVSFRFKTKIVSGHIRLSSIELQKTVKIKGKGGRFRVGLRMWGIVGMVMAINKRVFRSAPPQKPVRNKTNTKPATTKTETKTTENSSKPNTTDTEVIKQPMGYAKSHTQLDTWRSLRSYTHA